MSSSRDGSSSFSSFSQLRQARETLAAAEAELEALKSELEQFEKQVEMLLGPLLDKLSPLDAEVKKLTSRLIDLRESRLFGDRRTSYSGPYFAHLPDPTIVESGKKSTLPSESEAAGATITTPSDPQAELKMLYRKLARRYHPDLARNESERVQNTDQMTAINQAYATGDLGSLRRLAGIYVPAGIPDYLHPTQHQTELERLQTRLRQVQEQIKHLEALPIIKLSLEAKLARRQGRSLLSEMANDLRRKLARKTAERDYLRAQLDNA
jgi:vacuolar-type H+-ATPase subunit I/STV1